jgi:hypothetical protein
LNTSEKQLFDNLKKAITSVFLQNNAAPSDIADWKGEDITLFQEDLFSKTKARVSEKWFYTYFKNDANKLPRIDMLNLLCNYVGFENWHTFQKKHTTDKVLSNTIFKKLVFTSVVLLAVFFVYKIITPNQYHFCFIDEDKKEPITSILNIEILEDGQSPVYLKTDTTGCFVYRSKSGFIHFVVQSPFYKTDTIYRNYRSATNQMVPLATDDYALILDYYSNGNISDLKKRQIELQKLIDDDALIYQLFKNNIGIEIYSKEEFIRRLTTPTNELRRIRILNKAFKNEQIVKLKFIVE